MDCVRFRHLRNLIGYDNERLAAMLNIPLAKVCDYATGNESIPETLADQLERFADWASEVGDTAVKRSQALSHLMADPRKEDSRD